MGLTLPAPRMEVVMPTAFAISISQPRLSLKPGVSVRMKFPMRWQLTCSVSDNLCVPILNPSIYCSDTIASTVQIFPSLVYLSKVFQYILWPARQWISVVFPAPLVPRSKTIGQPFIFRLKLSIDFNRVNSLLMSRPLFQL